MTAMKCRCADEWVGLTPRHGRSAYAIKSNGFDHPYDDSDFCRCLHVSPNPPVHMRDKSPEWRVLVDNWEELAELVRDEHSRLMPGSQRKAYGRIRELLEGARVKS